MKKFMLGAASALSILVGVGMLAASHTTVGVVAYNYGEKSVIADTQSDALKSVAQKKKKRDAMTAADHSLQNEKAKRDIEITESFVEPEKQVEKYAEIKKSKPAKDFTEDETAVAAKLEFDDVLFRRFDETREQYRLAANSLIGNDSTGMGSRQARSDKRSDFRQACATTRKAVAKGRELICSACRGSEVTTAST